MKKISLFILISIVLVVASSCKKEKHVCSISLNKVAIEMEIGTKQILMATVDNFGDVADEGFIWSSSDDAVAEVSATGEITAIAQGTAIITVSPNADPDISAQCHVTVISTRPPVMQVMLDKSTLRLEANTEAMLVATITPADANQSVTWQSSNVSIATVSATGEVSALSDGDAIITATAVSDTSKKAMCAVKVAPVQTGFDNEGEPGIDGSSWEKAYKIANVEQLTLLATRVNNPGITETWNNKHYVLTADIDFGATNTENWNPIGSINGMNTKFKGLFDGKNFSVKGKINCIAGTKNLDYVGIFGVVESAVIMNLHFNGTFNIVPKGDETPFMGAIAASIKSTVFENCSNRANITSVGFVGGIVGQILDASSVLSACVNYGTITSTNGGASGIAAGNSGALVVGCVNKATNIAGSLTCGGILASGPASACWSLSTSVTSSQNQPVGTISGRIGSGGGKITYCHWLNCAIYATSQGDSDKVENSASFTGTSPDLAQIAAMNAEWQRILPTRIYKYNNLGDIEKITQ